RTSGEKRVFLVILFTSFSGSLVSRIPGAVQKVATEQFGVVFNQTTAPTTALQQQYERANESANVAITAYNHAIGTALAEASANKVSTASAVAALVPDSVLDELNKAAQ
ncbi:hypothetical protein P9486_22365, partial [Escherichia coli]|uniref:hypothetical protein n=1 Tax=Escherichia coli TaxID=562 RepID=UPI00398B7567